MVKRFGIATRWAVQNQPGLGEPWLTVLDPDQGERDPTPEEQTHFKRSTALEHFAPIAEELQLLETAAAIYRAKVERPGTLVLRDDEIVTVSYTEDGSPSRQAIALPIHDSLIVLRSGVGHAKAGLTGAFVTLAKVRIRRTVDQASDVAGA